MSITEQIKQLRSIQRDLTLDERRATDEDLKADLAKQLEGLKWSIKTLESVKAQLEAQTYLVSIGV